MSQVDMKIRDIECPEWADEWQWKNIMNELGDLVIARVVGFSASICFCCGEIHHAPIVRQEDENMNLLFSRLGVDINTPEWATRTEWRG